MNTVKFHLKTAFDRTHTGAPGPPRAMVLEPSRAVFARYLDEVRNLTVI